MATPTAPQINEPARAVRAAHEYLLTASPNAEKFTNFRLEELTQDKDKNYLITLSYEVLGEFGFDRQREYKDFLVSREGIVISMKIRKI